MLERLRQWDLDENSTVELPNGRKVKFIKMDGMYAKWDTGEKEMATGNYQEFEKTEFGYKVLK